MSRLRARAAPSARSALLCVRAACPASGGSSPGQPPRVQAAQARGQYHQPRSAPLCVVRPVRCRPPRQAWLACMRIVQTPRACWVRARPPAGLAGSSLLLGAAWACSSVRATGACLQAPYSTGNTGAGRPQIDAGPQRRCARLNTRNGRPVRCAYLMSATSSAPLKAIAMSLPNLSSACRPAAQGCTFSSPIIPHRRTAATRASGDSEKWQGAL